MMKLTALQFGFGVSILAHGLVFSVAPLLRSGLQNPSAASGGEIVLELMTVEGESDSHERNTPADAPQTFSTAMQVEKEKFRPAADPQENPVLTQAPDSPQSCTPSLAATPQTFTPAEAVEVDAFLEKSLSVLTVPAANTALPGGSETQDAKSSNASVRERSAVSVAYRSASPSYLYNPKPAYPKDARARRQQGRVIIALAVTADGLPQQVEINQTSGCDSLDQAALEAVRKWRFLPAQNGARPVASRVEIPFDFVLPN